LYIGAPGDTNTRFDMQRWGDALQEDPVSEQWAIETKDGEYIGDIDLHSIHVIRGEAWITPMVGDLRYLTTPDYRREAIALITEYAFSHHGVEKLLIDIPSTDQQGLEILRELGFAVVEEMLFDFLHDVYTVTMAVTPATFRRPSRARRAISPGDLWAHPASGRRPFARGARLVQFSLGQRRPGAERRRPPARARAPISWEDEHEQQVLRGAEGRQGRAGGRAHRRRHQEQRHHRADGGRQLQPVRVGASGPAAGAPGQRSRLRRPPGGAVPLRQPDSLSLSQPGA